MVIIRNQIIGFYILAAVRATATSGGPPFDFTVNSSTSYRPLTFTEKVFTNDWTKNSLTSNNHRKELITVQLQGLLFCSENINQTNIIILRKKVIFVEYISYLILITSKI
jgi:hypothetical protein